MTKIFLTGLMTTLFFFTNCSTSGNIFEGSGDVGNCKLNQKYKL